MALEVKRGDTWPPVRIILKATNAAGELVPIPKATLAEANHILFVMKHASALVEGACTVGSEEGEVIYTWAEGDTAVEGEYEVEVQVKWELGGKYQTIANSEQFGAIKIVRNLAAAH